MNRQPALSGLQPDGIVIIKQDPTIILNNHTAPSNKREEHFSQNGILRQFQFFCRSYFHLFQQSLFTLPSFSL